jgi:hypothetical protein
MSEQVELVVFGFNGSRQLDNVSKRKRKRRDAQHQALVDLPIIGIGGRLNKNQTRTRGTFFFHVHFCCFGCFKCVHSLCLKWVSVLGTRKEWGRRNRLGDSIE